MNDYPSELLNPYITPSLQSSPYVGIAYRYANNCLTYQEYEAIRWLTEYFMIQKSDLSREREYFGQITIVVREKEFRFGPIIVEFFWERKIPLIDISVSRVPNSDELSEVYLHYKANIPGIIFDKWL